MDLPTEYGDNVEPRSMSFVDGFQFGCGFFLAALVAGLLVALFLALMVFVLSLLGIRLLEGLLVLAPWLGLSTVI